MRVLLTSSACYAPPRGGSTRSNLIWMDQLAAAGHQCRIVSGTIPGAEEAVNRGGIEILQAVEAQRVQMLHDQITEFRPDWVLVSSEDLGHVLLREANHSAPGRVVYIAHTPQFFPFGPASWNTDRQGAALVAEAAGIVAIGRHMATYIERDLGRSAAVIHPPIYGTGPFTQYSNFDHGLITMINPCAVKGISIFLALAARFPEREFGVVPGWGTTAADRRAMERLPNIRFLPNPQHIEEALAQTRIMLMPSLWYEGFGLIVMESMLRGIPVISSNSGGLEDAKQGSGYVIPVHTIERWEMVFDEHGMPRPIIEPTPVEPWVAALEELLTVREAYQEEAERSRAAALRFVAGLDRSQFERYLLALEPRRAPAPRTGIESLSPEKRALLLQRLRHRRVETR
jgi:glycosyltransferase involved in cell wall biosynthesis